MEFRGCGEGLGAAKWEGHQQQLGRPKDVHRGAVGVRSGWCVWGPGRAEAEPRQRITNTTWKGLGASEVVGMVSKCLCRAGAVK